MKTTHTISIKENEAIGNGTVSARRVSQSRRYEACLVATVTPKVVADRLAKLEEDEAGLAERQAQLQALIVRHGLTVEEAKQKHEVDVMAWYDARQGVSKQILAESGKTYLPNLDKLVEDALVAKGLQYPYDLETYYGIVEADRHARNHKLNIKHLSRPVHVGDQLVVSWHATPALAQKGLGSQDAKHYSERGFSIAIRTDITYS